MSLQNKVTEAEWADLTRFEGNAQGFRILNKNQYGLKLTFATLGAFTKYPCPAFFPQRDPSKRSQKKFGFFQSEKTIFNEVATALELPTVAADAYERHPLTYLVEAADDICYSIIDLEDGCSLGLINYEDAKALFEMVLTKNKSKLGKLNQLNSKAEKTGFLRALAIGDLMDECATVFLDNEHQILNGTFNKALADLCPSKKGLAQIIDLSKTKIYRARNVVEIEASGHQVLPGLLEEFLTAGLFVYEAKKSRKHENLSFLFPEDILLNIQQASGYYTVARYVVDFVSGLTDRHAISLYRKIKGFPV